MPDKPTTNTPRRLVSMQDPAQAAEMLTRFLDSYIDVLRDAGIAPDFAAVTDARVRIQAVLHEIEVERGGNAATIVAIGGLTVLALRALGAAVRQGQQESGVAWQAGSELVN